MNSLLRNVTIEETPNVSDEPLSDPKSPNLIERPEVLKLLDNMALLIRALAPSSSALIIPPLRADIMSHLSKVRLAILGHLINDDNKNISLFLKHGFIWDFNALRFSGLLYEPLEPGEQHLVELARAEHAKGWKNPDAFRCFAIMLLYFQPHDLPFVTEGLEDIDSSISRLYLAFAAHNPVYVLRGEDEKHAQHLIRHMEWVEPQLSPNSKNIPWLLNIVIPHMDRLSIAHMIFGENNTLPVVKARAKLLHTLNRFIEYGNNYKVPEFTRKARPLKGRKLRIGYLIRSLGQGPDTQVILAEIGHFDPEKIEVYLYPRDVYDKSFQHNIGFYRRLMDKVTAIRSISNHPLEQMIEIVRKDELDIFAYHDATTYGFCLYNLMTTFRLAPIQISLNRIMSMSTGLDSFDFYVAARTPLKNVPLLALETTEEVRLVPGACMAYDRVNEVAPDKIITRQMLGVRENEILFLCGSAVGKIVPGCCDSFVRILAAIPNAKLVLAACNPAWGGVVFIPLLEARLKVALKKYGVSRDRIILVNQLNPQDTHQLLDLADVYLCQWPHGGATWLTKCLSHAVPVIVMDTVLLKGIGDQSLIRGAGFEELVAKDEDDYVRLAMELASNKELRTSITQRMRAMQDKMPHNDIATYSHQMQEFYLSIADEMAERAATTAQSQA